tara:strand:- start:370 stop:1209 length:840 start_codon:yes stop_codon:yes gene_type:complete
MMDIIKFFLIVTIIIFNVSCTKENLKEKLIEEKSLDSQVLEAYKLAKDALDQGDVLFAAKKFNEAEILFPQSDMAPKAALMAAYSYYSQDYYGDAINELDRFLKVYPKHKNIDYAYYLLSLSFYEQIVDEKKDLKSIVQAKKNFQILIKNFPNSDYKFDSELKLELINDVLASKEMYVGRYYFNKKKWIASINRFRTVVDNYETTIYTEEALHRLVEIYYVLGLKKESEKYAKLLGYNYQSSEWYEKSYSVFNKNYVENKIKKEKKKKFFLSKFKSLFN